MSSLEITRLIVTIHRSSNKAMGKMMQNESLNGTHCGMFSVNFFTRWTRLEPGTGGPASREEQPGDVKGSRKSMTALISEWDFPSPIIINAYQCHNGNLTEKKSLQKSSVSLFVVFPCPNPKKDVLKHRRNLRLRHLIRQHEPYRPLRHATKDHQQTGKFFVSPHVIGDPLGSTWYHGPLPLKIHHPRRNGAQSFTDLGLRFWPWLCRETLDFCNRRNLSFGRNQRAANMRQLKSIRKLSRCDSRLIVLWVKQCHLHPQSSPFL